MQAAGINRPDVMQRMGDYPPPPGAGDVLGLEIAGTVEELGQGASRFKAGDRVMALVASGAYAEWAVVHETNALPVPDGMSLVEAGAVPETYFTVWSNVFERAALQPGETMLLHGGTSGIGTTATMLAKALGSTVIVTCGSDEKCDAALKVGADVAINYRTDDFVEVARKATDGKGPDVVVDMVGGPYMQRNLDVVAVDGRIAQIAYQQGSKAGLDTMPLLIKRLTWTGSDAARAACGDEGAACRRHRETCAAAAGRRCRPPLVDSTFALNDVRSAHQRMDDGLHVGKIVLTMQESSVE